MYSKLICSFTLILFANLLNAQKTVTGIVRSKFNHKPLDEVTVFIKGTTTGTTTNKNGHFQITVPNDQSILVFRFIGLLTKEILVNEQATINVSMDHGHSPSSYLQYGVLSGVNHTPLGFQVQTHIRRLRSFPVNLKMRYERLFGKGNSKNHFRISREGNWRFLGVQNNTSFNIKSRIITADEFTQNLRELAIINAYQLKKYELGVGLGLQTNREAELPQEDFAFVAELGRHVYFGGDNYLKIGVKKWQKNTQINWAIHKYLPRSRVLFQVQGEHLKTYNEITLGLAIDITI